MLTRNPGKLIILTALSCFLLASVYGQTDPVSHWQIYLDDSLLISDHLTRLSLEQKPVLIDLNLRNVNPKSRLAISYQSAKPSNNIQQIYFASQDSLRLTQRYFKPNKVIRMKVRDLLYFQQDELWLYYSNEQVVKPSPKPYGHLIVRVGFKN